MPDRNANITIMDLSNSSLPSNLIWAIAQCSSLANNSCIRGLDRCPSPDLKTTARFRYYTLHATHNAYHASDSKQMTGWGSVSGYSFFAFSTREQISPAYMGFAVPLAVQRKYRIEISTTKLNTYMYCMCTFIYSILLKWAATVGLFCSYF